VWLQPAETRGDRGALGKALAAIKTVTARGAPTGQDLLLLGRALSLAGDANGALLALREATARLPVQAAAFERLATAAERLGGTGEARDALVRYHALLPDGRRQAVVAARIADLSARLRQPAAAVGWQIRAVDENPGDSRLLARLAELQGAAGDRPAARATLARAIAAGAPAELVRRVEIALQ
jgi:tetratricopeptide (TPR) repeat protein